MPFLHLRLILSTFPFLCILIFLFLHLNPISRDTNLSSCLSFTSASFPHSFNFHILFHTHLNPTLFLHLNPISHDTNLSSRLSLILAPFPLGITFLMRFQTLHFCISSAFSHDTNFASLFSFSSHTHHLASLLQPHSLLTSIFSFLHSSFHSFLITTSSYIITSHLSFFSSHKPFSFTSFIYLYGITSPHQLPHSCTFSPFQSFPSTASSHGGSLSLFLSFLHTHLFF